MNRRIRAESVYGYDVGASGYCAVLATASPSRRPTTLYAHLQSVAGHALLAGKSLARDGCFFYGFKVQMTPHAPPNMDIQNPKRRPEVF